MGFFSNKTIVSLFITAAVILTIGGCNININSGNYNHTAQAQATDSTPVGNIESIFANLTHTDLILTGEDTNQCAVEATFTVRAKTQEIADEVSSLIELKLVQANGQLEIVVVKPQIHPDKHSIRTKMTITAPKSVAYQMVTTHGDCNVSNIEKSVSIKSTHGDFQLQQIQGDIIASSTHGDININDATNESINITTTHGKVSLDKANTHAISISTTHDPISLQDVVADSLNLRTTHDPIRLNVCKAREASLHTSHGPITGNLDGVETLTARTTHDPIKLTCTHETNPEIVAILSTSHDHIEFTPPAAFAGKLSLSTTHGRIQTDRAMMVQGGIGKEQINGTIGDGEGSITMTSTHGNLTLK